MKRLLTSFILIVSVITLGGCERYIYGEAPAARTAPKSSAKTTPPPKPAAAAKKAAAAQADLANTAANPGEVVVKKGETLYGIARAHKVALRDLITVNRLAPPYELKTGQRLVLPEQRVHEVRRGETIYAISRRYGVTMSELARINGLEPTSPIKIGQRLRLPASIRPQSRLAALPKSIGPQTQAQKSLPKSRPKSGVSTAELPPPTAPQTPQALGDAPDGRQNITAPELTPPDAPNVPDAPGAGVAPKGPVSYPEPAPRTGGRFAWPVRGKVESPFGAGEGGLHNDGINIMAKRGTPVKAAETGVIVYAGNELRGFGNLLLIKHADGWTSAYAHNQKILVKRGDRVKKGQKIAQVGSTGNVSTPQLHFELRKGSQAVDPQKHL